MDDSIDTITLRPTTVPQYLKESDFYKSLNSESDEEFSIAKKHLKNDVAINSEADLCNLLSTIQFWGLSAIPTTVLDYLVFQVKNTDPKWLSEYEEAFPLLADAKAVRLSDAREKVAVAARSASLEFFSYYVTQYRKSINNRTLSEAAAHGRLANLAFAIDRITFNLDEPSKLCRQAAQGGHLDCLKLLYDSGCPTDKYTCNVAAGNGHLDCLKYAHENGFHWGEHTIMDAMTGGHLGCVIYAHTNGCLWPKQCHLRAAEHGHLDCMKYGLDLLKAKSPQVAVAACAGGNLECLQYVVAHGYKLSANAYTAAVKHGHFQCLQFLHTHGCEADSATFSAAVCTKNWRCLRFLFKHELNCAHDGVEAAVMYDSVDALKIAQDCGAAIPAHTAANAALRFAVEHGCPVNAETTAAAATNYSGLEVLVYLREIGCPWDATACAAAAQKSKLKILTYLHEHGCPWDETVCAAAASSYNVECLQYLHVHDCPWDHQTLVEAAKRCARAFIHSYDSACLEYALENGCPRSVEVTMILAGGSTLQLLQYAREYGCPWDESVSTAAEHCAEMLAYCVENGCAESMRVYNRNKDAAAV